MADAADFTEELFERAPCGLILTSPRGEILAVNATFLGWIGRSADQVVGRVTFSQLMNVAGRIYYETHIAPLLRMQGFVNEIAVDLVGKHGVALPVFVSATEARNSSGEPQSIKIAVFHAADRRKYERELVVARRMAEEGLKAKSDFLAVFAHEVRNGLNAVFLAATVLRRQELPPSAAKPLATLRSSLDRVLTLLQNMLDLSKVEAGKLELERRRFNLRELLHGVVQTVEPAAERKHIAVQVDIGERCPELVLGDAVKIGQVLSNLAGNAVKFTEKGQVTVAAELLTADSDSATIRFRISDTGIGIAPDRIARIWDDFSQGGPEIAARYGGTGLGLSISRRLIERHGSRIEVESRPGSGTSFWFDLRLPIAEAPTAQAPAP
jgi:PAS domain S-box-containing protein